MNTEQTSKNIFMYSEIMIFFWKYDLVISGTLAGFFFNMLCFLLAVILSELHEKPRRKDWVTEKST